MMMKKKNFTLIELLIVMTVIMILAGISLGVSGYVIRKNKEARTLATIEMLKLGLEQYKAKYGFYIPSIPHGTGYIQFQLDQYDAAATTGSQKNTNNFNQFVDFMNLIQPEQSKLDDGVYKIKDGFGNPVLYRCPGKINKTSFDLGSKGSDGKYGDGSTDEADFGKGDDITNCKR